MAKKEEAIQSLELEHQKSMSKNEENVKLVHNLEETVSGLQRENKMANGRVCKSLCKTWYFLYEKYLQLCEVAFRKASLSCQYFI